MDVLWQLLGDFFGRLQCFTIVDQYEEGVLLRCGKYVRTVKPGLVWQWPIIDAVLTDNIVPTTTNLDTQILTTCDGNTVLIGAVLRWRIEDVKKVLLELEDPDDVLFDTAYGMIAEAAQSTTYDDLESDEFRSEVREGIRRRMGKYGIHVEEVFLTDIAKTRSFHLT
jgi:regulator of protease activity HflC (stomatin/prohibitin superfamily)